MSSNHLSSTVLVPIKSSFGEKTFFHFTKGSKSKLSCSGSHLEISITQKTSLC